MYMVQKGFLKVHLKKQLYSFKMDEGGDIKGRVNGFKTCDFKLLQVDVNIQDKDQIIILLSSLSQS